MFMRTVQVRSDECATADDVMQLIARLPYKELRKLADWLRADPAVIADAPEEFYEEHAGEKAEAEQAA